jgi:putative transposase
VFDFPDRQSIRLKGYDYSQNGMYFVTICVQHVGHILGEIKNNKMNLNDAGKMVEYWWNELPKHFSSMELGAYQVMPNHIHGIIIVGVDRRVDPQIKISKNNTIGRTHRSAPTLGTMIQWFKTMTTNEYLRHVKTDHWEPFSKRIFQRNYYEHIVRNEPEYNKICFYIIHNPEMWERDRNNLNNI